MFGKYDHEIDRQYRIRPAAKFTEGYGLDLLDSFNMRPAPALARPTWDPEA